ncbi:UNVERIFIED_CONTAM: hypothetical protein PYX00_003051 [Menopon gallinae]|uniref:Uncharacterized protein n=1 Tax=Menopon gallinae TaxID=328185 RepID=A0AAW2HZI2_9NEOP
MLQFLDLCRLCGQKKRNKLDLFAQDDEETRTLIAKISFCLAVHITKEDMLPKMVCQDCQKSIEQLNAFRLKCQKAEEKLNKMLSFILPNKVLVTRIKEECLETDSNEHSPAHIDSSPVVNDPLPLINLKPVQNVKLEIYESEDENIDTYSNNRNSDLIQIISEEIVHNNSYTDVKQPIIEIISENYIDDFKNRDFSQHEENAFCDVKLMESANNNQRDTQQNCGYQEIGTQLVDPAAVIEVKMQDPESECELEKECPVQELSKEKSEGRQVRSKVMKRRKRKDIVESDVEVDKKYLVLGENEECDIDIEEMDALIKKKQNPNVRFDCNKCKKSFKFFKCLKKHRILHENEPESFICDICCNNNAKNFEFSSLKTLKSHIQRKHLQGTGGKYKCNFCNRTLISQGQLNAHFRKVHDNTGASCQVCGKSFKNKTRLTDHLKVHNEEKPYVCDQCGQSFKWNNGLKVHIQSHNQEKNFLCSECGRKFSAKKNLLEHLNIHTGKRPHVCKFCKATFTQLSAYSKHLYVHNQEQKIHKCDKCEKTFSHSYLLKQHKLHHTGLRPYSCSVCFNSFKSQSDLCTHVKIHQEKQYSCSVCGRKFSRSKTLRDHMVRHTGIKHICPVPGCGKTYTQRFPLTKHFWKNHPSLRIINRLGGKKAHLGDRVMYEQENCPELDYIRYEYKQADG